MRSSGSWMNQRRTGADEPIRRNPSPWTVSQRIRGKIVGMWNLWRRPPFSERRPETRTPLPQFGNCWPKYSHPPVAVFFYFLFLFFLSNQRSLSLHSRHNRVPSMNEIRPKIGWGRRCIGIFKENRQGISIFVIRRWKWALATCRGTAFEYSPLG